MGRARPGRAEDPAPSLKRVVTATLAVWTNFLSSPAGQTTLFHFEVQGDTVVGVEEQYRP